LTSYDLPQTLINKIKTNFGSKGFSIHSLIVKPGALTGGTAAATETMLVPLQKLSRQ